MKTEPKEFQFFIDRLTKMNSQELKKGLRKDAEQSEQEHKLFLKSFSENKCYLCGEKFIRCDYNKPCIHWLLRGHKRIKKKHIEQALKTKDLFQIIAFLRWLATTQDNLSFINDLEGYEEQKSLVYIETIKYKSITWSFWVKKEDLVGHKSRLANFPHYHLHMTINNLSFVNFGDFHIPLSEWDIFNIHARRGKFKKFKYFIPYGETYSDLFDLTKEEEILQGMRTVDNPKQAKFHLQTFIEAKPGKTLKGDDLAAIVKESKRTGVPLAKLASKLGGTVKTIVTPMNLVDPVTRKKSQSGR